MDIAVKNKNSRRLLLTFGSLADLGPVLAGEGDFREVSSSMLRLMMEAVDVREGVLFTFHEKPAHLVAAAWSGFALFPDAGFIPLLSRQVNALVAARGPETYSGKSWDAFLSPNGNVAPDLFKCIIPLCAGNKLAGLVALGAREGGAGYDAEELEALGTLSHYIALAVQNHNLSQTLQQRVVEHLRLVDSMHGFCDQTMEVFATAIDAKEFRSGGHSLRVGRYSAALGSALELNSNEVAELRASGYLHDIGKVAVDKRLFNKPAALEPNEFREMADHTLVGHKIVAGVQFPWPRIADVVRWHHERSDGSGYPDHLASSEIPLVARIVAVADTLDAMTSERPYRNHISVGQSLSEIVRFTPNKFDPEVVQSLLTLMRGEASGRGQRFLDPQVICNIAPSDVDQLAADLKYKVTHGRAYSA
jgi:HD-GYP domain-containing protein (c-di-GMP phosphodiesterase class II)